MSTSLPWCVVGQGALGSLVAVRLAQLHQQVSLKLRHEQGTSIVHEGSSWRFTSAAELQEPSLIFAAVKAYHVAPLLAELQRSPAFAQSQLILSYNGMLTDETQLLRAHDWHWVTTHGAYRDGDQVIHAGRGESWLGSLQRDATPPDFFATLEAALPPLHWQQDIRLKRWQKLAINCLINPYTVVHQCVNGDLVHRVKMEEWQRVADEIVQLAAQRDVVLQSADLLMQAQRVVQQTARNRSSMLQDFLQQRPLEVAYLNGFVATASAAAGLKAPANERLFTQVQSLSSIKSRTSSPKPDSAE